MDPQRALGIDSKVTLARAEGSNPGSTSEDNPGTFQQ